MQVTTAHQGADIKHIITPNVANNFNTVNGNSVTISHVCVKGLL